MSNLSGYYGDDAASEPTIQKTQSQANGIANPSDHPQIGLSFHHAEAYKQRLRGVAEERISTRSQASSTSISSPPDTMEPKKSTVGAYKERLKNTVQSK